MRYHLLHRFSGGLIGSLLAELSAVEPEINLAQIERRISWASRSNIAMLDWIIDQSKFDLSDSVEPSIVEWLTTAKVSEIAVASLPLMIWWHEEYNWLETCSSGAASVPVQLAQIIGDRAREDLPWWSRLVGILIQATNFPPYLSNHSTNSPEIQAQLRKIETLIQQGKSLDGALSEIGKLPLNWEMAIAYYCFASTPKDFELAVRRAIHCSDSNPTVAALTGAMAGIANTVAGIPIGWKQRFKEVKLLLELEKKAKTLFALWSGVYQPETEFDWEQSTITTAGLIQPRHQLQIISQI